jgi:hypothetical protein
MAGYELVLYLHVWLVVGRRKCLDVPYVARSSDRLLAEAVSSPDVAIYELGSRNGLLDMASR